MLARLLTGLAAAWPAEAARRALLGVPAMALVLGIGIATGHPAAALIAGGGALSVGFGSYYPNLTRYRHTPMLLAGTGMAVSAAVGSLVGHSEPALLATSLVWSLLCAWLIGFGTGPWWIVLQWAVGLFVSSAYAASVPGAALRGGLILAGAAVQFTIISTFWHYRVLAPPSADASAVAADFPQLALRRLRSNQNQWPYVFAAVLTVGLALIIERAIDLPNGYWAPMTGLIVIRPDLRQTWARVLQRIVGTLIGAGVASVLATALRPAPALIAAFILLFTWSAYASRAFNYGVFTASITGAIVFLLSLTGAAETLNAWHRVLATLLGALLALCVRAAVRALRSDQTASDSP